MPTTTLNYTAPQGARVVAAFGKELGLGQNATEAQVKAEIWNFVRLVVAKWEEQNAVDAAVAQAKAGLSDLGGVS